MSGNVQEPLGEWWVTFDVSDAEAARLEEATGTGDGDARVGGVVATEPNDGNSLVTFQVHDHDPDDAFQQALQAYAALRRRAELPEAPPVSASFTRLRDAPGHERVAPGTGPARKHARHDELLDEARSCLQSGQLGYATVLAQAACEQAIASAIRRLVAHKYRPLQTVLEGMIDRKHTLRDLTGRRLWQALTGEQIHRASFWERYGEHIARRNSIVHEGSSVSSHQAEASLAVALEVCEHVTRLSP